MKLDQMQMLPYNRQSSDATADGGEELSRLITAAVVSEEFCSLLLRDPALAIASGYSGEDFYFTPEETARIVAVQATTLREFAEQLLDPERQYDAAPLPHPQARVETVSQPA